MVCPCCELFFDSIAFVKQLSWASPILATVEWGTRWVRLIQSLPSWSPLSSWRNTQINEQGNADCDSGQEGNAEAEVPEGGRPPSSQWRRLCRFELRPEGRKDPAEEGLRLSSEVAEDFAS